MATSAAKVRGFISAVVALVAGICIVAIAAEVMGFSIPVINAIPHAIGIVAGE